MGRISVRYLVDLYCYWYITVQDFELEQYCQLFASRKSILMLRFNSIAVTGNYIFPFDWMLLTCVQTLDRHIHFFRCKTKFICRAQMNSLSPAKQMVFARNPPKITQRNLAASAALSPQIQPRFPRRFAISLLTLLAAARRSMQTKLISRVAGYGPLNIL